MEKNRPIHLQEILFGSSDKAESRRISQLVKQGTIIKIAPSLYTSNLHDTPESIIKRNWFRILAAQYPKALLSHRSALECRPTPKEGHIYLSYTYNKVIELPGMIIHLQAGPPIMEGDNSFFAELYLSQQARAFLENFQQSRKTGEQSRTLTREQIEERLESIIRVKGEDGLNAMRDRAREIAPALDMEKEFLELNKIVSAMLTTKPVRILSSSVGKARALGEPFDPGRIALFELLYGALAGNNYPDYADKNTSRAAYQNFAFFESYFSNYIEGTIFEVEEARQIITTETPLPARNEDSHDVLGTYKIVSNQTEMSICPSSPSELIDLLFRRHAILLSARTDKNPGQFKHINNRAGDTEFVDWQLVMGTLKKGFDWYSLLQHPFAKAIYMMFLVSEVHPFLDGNGRVARVMLNAELSCMKLSKIIIPTVYREDYVGALRRLTRQNDPDPYIRMMLRAYEFSSTIYGEDNYEMEKYLNSCDAFKEPKHGKLHF
ncbi:MAG: Fic family protein [Bacteroidetes bacterium]|nr:Fic family protein [Bacteroidota bacterium]